MLTIPVDAPHPLFQAVGVPGDVVVEEDVAALEVDALAGRLGGHQDLDVPLTELLLHEEPGPRMVPGPRLHSAMDLPRAESPELEAVQDVVQGVPELGEDQQALFGIVEEPLLVEDGVELVELRLAGGILDCPGPLGQMFKLFYFPPDFVDIPGQRHRVQQLLQALPVGVIHLLQVGEIGRSLAGQVLGLLEPGIQPAHPVFQGADHGVGAGGEAPLVEGHQELDGPGPPVVAHLVGPHALSFKRSR